jgi:hypothetical protein
VYGPGVGGGSERWAEGCFVGDRRDGSSGSYGWGVIALLTTTVEVVHGGVVSMQEQSVLTKELACWTRDEKSVSRGSGFFVVVGLGFVRLLRAEQAGVMVIVVTALGVT